MKPIALPAFKIEIDSPSSGCRFSVFATGIPDQTIRVAFPTRVVEWLGKSLEILGRCPKD